MKSCLYKVFSISCLLFLLSNNAYTKEFSDSPTQGDMSNEGIYSNNSVNNAETQESDYFPFKKSAGKFNDNKVRGITILSNKIVFLSEDMEFYEENVELDKVLSDPEYFKSYKNLKSVDLNNLKLTSKVLKQLQMFLPTDITSLVVKLCSIDKNDYLDFTTIITERKKIHSITIVDPQSALGESAKLLTAISNLGELRYLSLTLGELESHGCDSLTEILDKSASSLTKLQLGLFKFDRTSFAKRTDNNGKEIPSAYDSLQKVLRNLKKLNLLEYSIIESDAIQIAALCGSLKELKHLRELKLYISDYNDHDEVQAFKNAEILSESLSSLAHLESLDISYMELPYAALQVVCRSLANMPQLRALKISGNPFNEKTASVLGESLKSLDNLHILVATNCSISGQSFNLISSGLSNSSIKNLYLSDNKIGNSITSLSLSNMHHLELMDVSYNDIPLTDISKFWTTNSSAPKTLEVINWRGNTLQGEYPKDEAERIRIRDEIKIKKRSHNIRALDLGI